MRKTYRKSILSCRHFISTDLYRDSILIFNQFWFNSYYIILDNNRLYYLVRFGKTKPNLIWSSLVTFGGSRFWSMVLLVEFGGLCSNLVTGWTWITLSRSLNFVWICLTSNLVKLGWHCSNFVHFAWIWSN